jgi:hypothetical protein
MPMVSMKTKKPMLEMLAITDEAGLSSPNASERPDEQHKPSDPPRQRPGGPNEEHPAGPTAAIQSGPAVRSPGSAAEARATQRRPATWS